MWPSVRPFYITCQKPIGKNIIGTLYGTIQLLYGAEANLFITVETIPKIVLHPFVILYIDCVPLLFYNIVFPFLFNLATSLAAGLVSFR